MRMLSVGRISGEKVNRRVEVGMVKTEVVGRGSGRDRGQKSDVGGREKIMECLNNLWKSAPACA